MKVTFAKLDPNGSYWTHGWRVTKGNIGGLYKTKKDVHQNGSTVSTIWEYWIEIRIEGQCDG